MTRTRLYSRAGWTFRVQDPASPPPNPLLLMFHGLTGDEKSMWIFSGHISGQVRIISLRGLYPTPYGGYGWVENAGGELAPLSDFRPAVDALIELLVSTDNLGHVGLDSLHVMGFSQGAALSYAIGLLHPQRVKTVAGLSGFLPDGSDLPVMNQPMRGLKVFIAHGTRDKLVPIERGRQSVFGLQQAGADVTYCEDDVGHKLSPTCMRALGHFYMSNFVV